MRTLVAITLLGLVAALSTVAHAGGQHAPDAAGAGQHERPVFV